jgi:transposase
VASFPQGVSKAAQYGTGIKAHSVYMSQFQLIPYNRIQDYFADQLGIPISEGSIFNFNQEAYQLLADFENRPKPSWQQLRLSTPMKPVLISAEKDTGCMGVQRFMDLLSAP